MPSHRGSDRRQDLCAEVAWLYYRAKLGQEEIAQRLQMSRSTVSRLLKQALDSGIVEIRIRHPLPLADQIQRDLIATFGLRDAMVLETRGGHDSSLAQVGRLAARYVETTLGLGDSLAISWGTAVRAVADGLEPHTPPEGRDIEVIQMLGGAGSGDLSVDGRELARRVATLLGGHCRYLNVPLVVDDAATATALRRQRSIKETLSAASHADLAVVGVGALVPDVSSLLRAGHLTRDELVHLREVGAVGDVCGNVFDAEGRPVDDDIPRRIVTVDADALRRFPRLVAVAVGTVKAEAIRGALKAKFVTVLVTDDLTARAVLDAERGR